MASPSKSALLLLSGGPDSAVMAAWAVEQGYSCRGLFLRLNDDAELQRCAEAAAAKVNIKLDVIDVTKLTAALTPPQRNTTIPFFGPVTFWIAASHATNLNVECVMFGAIEDDGARFEGNLQESFAMLEKMTRMTVKNFQIRLPFIGMKKQEVFSAGNKLGVDFKKTVSCVRPSGEKHCGNCVPCQARYDAFKSAGILDPTEYEMLPRGEPVEDKKDDCIGFI